MGFMVRVEYVKPSTLFYSEFTKKEGIPIVGLNYRDNPGAALNVLSNDGNPYSTVISDPQGKLALNSV